MNPDSSSGRWSFFKLAAIAFVLLMALAVVVVGVAIGLRVQTARRASPTLTLSDGTRIQFVGTATGNQPFSSDTPWLKRARKILPTRLQQRWLPRSFTAFCGSASNGLTLYLRVTRPTPLITSGWSSYDTEDDTGFHYAVNGGSCSIFLSATEQAYGLGLAAYPRRQKSFLFHLKDSRGVVIATFRIPNPYTGPFPEWQPLPMPQAVTNSTGTLTLLSVGQRLRAGTAYPSSQWRFHSDQPGWSNARVRYSTYLDATGNEGSRLSPLEPAWKVRAQVMRPNESDFAPVEKFTLTNLTLKPPNEFLSIDQSNVIVGSSVNVSVLCGPGCLNISNGTSRTMLPGVSGRTGYSISSSSSGGKGQTNQGWCATNSFFLVEVANIQSSDEVRFVLRDDQDREIEINSSGWSGGVTGTRIYQPQFTSPPDAKSVSLEIFVDRPQIFDFLINPKDVKPPARDVRP